MSSPYVVPIGRLNVAVPDFKLITGAGALAEFPGEVLSITDNSAGFVCVNSTTGHLFFSPGNTIGESVMLYAIVLAKVKTQNGRVLEVLPVANAPYFAVVADMVILTRIAGNMSFASIVLLRGATDLPDGLPIVLRGGVVAGDGGGGLYYFDAGSVAVDDGVTVIRPDAIAAEAPGRILKLA